MNRITAFFKEHIVGMAIFAVLFGVIGNFVFEYVKPVFASPSNRPTSGGSSGVPVPGGSTGTVQRSFSSAPPLRVEDLEVSASASARTKDERVTITLTVKNTSSTPVAVFGGTKSGRSLWGELTDATGGNEYRSFGGAYSAVFPAGIKPGGDPRAIAAKADAGLRIEAGASGSLTYTFRTNRDWRKPTTYSFNTDLLLLRPVKDDASAYSARQHTVKLDDIPSQ